MIDLYLPCVRGSCDFFFFFQAEDGIRYLGLSRGLGDVYKRQRMVKLVDILDNAPYQKIPTLLTKSRRFANVETTRGAGTIRWS